jgi:hypothetical protein
VLDCHAHSPEALEEIMKAWTSLLALAVSTLCTVSFVDTASAQATRTWVSGVGDDVNPCSRTAPCKTFAGAISKTAAGGEINCLDPGGFGAVTVTKSITIDCTGTFGSVLASSSTGVILNGASIDVVLRGLSINGGTPALPGVNGIRFLQGASLIVEDCIITNFRAASPNGHGILVNNTSGTVELTVTNTVIANNGTGTAGGGIQIAPITTGGAKVVIDNVQAHNNIVNIRADTSTTSGGVEVSISNTVASQAPFHGFVAIAGTGPVKMMLDSTVSSSNAGEGVRVVGAGATIRIGRSTVTNNGIGLQTAGGTLQSYGTNQVTGNLNDGVAPAVIAQK